MREAEVSGETKPHLVVDPLDTEGPHIYYADVKAGFHELLMERLLGE